MSATITMDTSGLESYLDQLGDAADSAIRPAAQAGAQVFYDRVRSNVAALGRVSGNLASAIYQVFSEAESPAGKASYHISWNHIKAPHGHLVEFGYIQRYQVVRTSKGLRVAVRPEMAGKPKPGRRASQAVKDAYFVPLPGGPRQIPGKAFTRSAQSAAQQALAAATAELIRRIEEVK